MDSPVDTEEINSRVYMHNPHIIYYNELKSPTPQTIEHAFAEVKRLAATKEKCGLIIDIRNSDPPNAATRRTINASFSSICDMVNHVSFVSGKNIIVNTAAKFIMFQTNLKSFTINGTVEDGIAEIEKVVNG